MTQTVAGTPASSRRVFIAGACAGLVYIWEKKPKIASRDSEEESSPIPTLGDNGFWSSQGPAMVLAIMLTYSNWSPYLFKVSHVTIFVEHFLTLLIFFAIACGILDAHSVRAQGDASTSRSRLEPIGFYCIANYFSFLLRPYYYMLK